MIQRTHSKVLIGSLAGLLVLLPACDRLKIALGEGFDPFDEAAGGQEAGSIDACEAELKTCQDAGKDPDSCKQSYESCINAQTSSDPCTDELNSCLDAGKDPEPCKQAYESCIESAAG
jgi:hypothetical protein